MMDRAVQRSPTAFPGLSSAGEVFVREILTPLGLTKTNMGRLGRLMLRKGGWNGRQIIDEDYVYRMSHPSFEDANTAYGYLTWLNATGGNADSGAGNGTDNICNPYAAWQHFPHPPSFEPSNSEGGSPFPNHRHDIGAFEAVGLFGQMIFVHRGLDLVIAVREGDGAPQFAWNQIRPALVALDPVYAGDEAAFCDAYRSSSYAPDLVSAWESGSGFGALNDKVDPAANPAPAPPDSGPTGLDVHRNNIGFGQIALGGANFNRAGDGFMDLLFTPTGTLVRPGDSFSVGDITYHLPSASPGVANNIESNGQTIFPEGAVAGATKLGLLGAGNGGSASRTITVNYSDGTFERHAIRMPD